MKFKVAGVSTLNGKVKVRFGSDLVRVKLLVKQGHTDVELRELPEDMDKPAAVKFLKASDLYQNPVWQEVIDAADAKYNPVAVVKVKAEKTAKVKSTKAKSKVTETKPNLEDLKARAAEAQTAEPEAA